MACSEGHIKQKRTLNDTEVEDTLSKSYTVSPNFKEKPLSPILTGGLNNRKFLIGKRLSRKKPARVKLTDRFKDDSIVTPIVSIPACLDEGLSLSQTKNLIEHLDELEELDNRRKNIYKVLVTNNKNSDNNFKIPKSPAPLRIEKVNKNDVRDTCNSQSSKPGNSEVISLSIKETCEESSVAFQTATGKQICISDTDVSKYSKLFEDIIHPTQNDSMGRKNKYTFLRKNYKHTNFKTNIDLTSKGNDLFIDKLKSIQFNEKSQLVDCNPFEGFSTASGSKIKVSKKAVTQAKGFFNEEDFDDIVFSRKSISGVKKQMCINENSSEKGINILNITDELSFTQAICESGISNTQILTAVDKILCSVETTDKSCFRGFSKEDITESHRKVRNMKNILAAMKIEKSKFSVECDSMKRQRIDQSSHTSSLDDCFLPLKKARILEQFPQNKEYNNLITINNNLGGFKSASGKSIIVSKKYVKHADAIFKDIDKDFRLDNFKSTIENKFALENERDMLNRNSPTVFHAISKNTIKLPEDTLTREKDVFVKQIVKADNKSDTSNKDVDETYLPKVKNENIECFSKTVITSNNCSLQMLNSNMGFSKASGKAITVREDSLKKAKDIFDDLSMEDSTLIGENSTSCLGNYIKPSVKADHFEIEKIYTKGVSVAQDSLTSEFSLIKNKLVAQSTPVTTGNVSKTGVDTNIQNSKKKLGVSRCKQLQISDSKLDRAKLLFDEDFSGISPIKPRQSTTYTSTPIRQNNYLTPVRNNYYLKTNENFDTFMDTTDITPIKMTKDEKKQKDTDFNTKSVLCATKIQKDVDFITDENVLCTSPTKSNWMDDLRNERRNLETRLQIISEREKFGENLLHCLNIGKSNEDKKPREGILYRTKTICKRKSLFAFINNENPGETPATVKSVINSKNAENLHFKCPLSTSIVTKDGAVVIPNVNDLVGLTEIKNGFEAMPGVEPRLIPKGWIRNHYKWIVWKLSSYDNKFPSYFSGCLSIENVIQQLKYRYDREIDKAERSALRKIYEKDDAPQKRIILYVSDVKKLDSKNYELELSDGWYAIRTVIDEPLCHQINNGRIEMGTKLILSGAELLNCEGCHPLEATNFVCLKINCNSTRRAVWYAKLGYQRDPNPFPIQLQGIYPLGGPISAIKIGVVRVYPPKYLEKLDNCSVWRNKKAEEIAAQKWENERGRRLEQIQYEIRQKYDHPRTKPVHERSSLSDILNIKCPKRLLEVLENSNDPECLQEKLSSAQKEAILSYQANLSMKKQAEIAAEVNESISKLKLTKRDVVAVLKLLIIDLIGDSNRAFNFFIWRPTETHLQSLIEGKSFFVQNVIPRPNGDLNSNMKTTFKIETENSVKCSRYKRHVLLLEELVALNSPPDFNEFDTVGIVVQIKIESHTQEVWMADNQRRLLFITIVEGPSTCSLLDNLKRGQTTTVCNLMYRGMKKDVIQANGSHFTIFTSNSRYKHLQEGLAVFNREVKDVQSLLSDCDTKIEVFKIISDIKNSFSDSVDENMFS